MAWTDAARAASAAVRRAHAKGRAQEVRAGNRRLSHVYAQSVANVMNTYKKPSKGLAKRLMRMTVRRHG